MDKRCFNDFDDFDDFDLNEFDLDEFDLDDEENIECDRDRFRRERECDENFVSEFDEDTFTEGIVPIR